MSLLLLPLEIFRQVLELAVTSLGPLHATNLRLVCRLFDRETLHAYAKTELFRCPTPGHIGIKDYKSRISFVARYLLERPHTENSPTNRNIATLMNYTVDELVKLDKGATSENLRSQYMRTLCHASSRYYSLETNIFPAKNRLVSTVDDRYHVIIAAIYLKRYTYARDMLDNEQINITAIKSEVFGTPLIAALETKQLGVVRELLQRGADVNIPWPGRTLLPLWEAVHTRDINFVRLLLEPQFECNTSGEAFEYTIYEAIFRNIPDIACLLLQGSREGAVDLKFVLAKCLRAACCHGLIDIVRLLLNDVHDLNALDATEIGAGMVEQAAWKGQEEVLRFLLSRGANPVGKCAAIIAAVSGGHIGAVRILVDAGVKYGPYTWELVLYRTASLPESVEIVRMLLESGTLDVSIVKEETLLTCMAIACQQGNIGFVKVLAEHGVTMDDESVWGRYGYPPAIVAAKSTRQDHVVKALLDMGVPDVDPLKSAVSDLFASGKLPMDRPDNPYPTKMPYLP